MKKPFSTILMLCLIVLLALSVSACPRKKRITNTFDPNTVSGNDSVVITPPPPPPPPPTGGGTVIENTFEDNTISGDDFYND